MLREKIQTKKFKRWVIYIIIYSIVMFFCSSNSFSAYCFTVAFIILLFFAGNPLLPDESRDKAMLEYSGLRFWLWLLVVVSFLITIFILCLIWPAYSQNIMFASAPPILGFLFLFRNPLKNPDTKQY